MKTLMFTGAATAAILLAAPAAQAGMVSTCTHADQTRIIEVVYTGEGVLTCEVHYSKDAGTQTLWSATNAAGYCEEKAAAFVEKQQGWGWECTTAISDDMQQTIDESVAAPATQETESVETVSEAEMTSSAETEAAAMPVTEAASAAPETTAPEIAEPEENVPAATTQAIAD